MLRDKGPRPSDPATEETGIEPFRPAGWQAAFDTVVSAIANGASIILVLAPAGHGKTTFLGQLSARLAAAGQTEDVVMVAPEATGEWLAPMLASLALSQPPLIAVDEVEKMTDAALRDLLLLATAPARTGRPASVILAGAPGMAKRVERLLPARQARSLPRATLAAWTEDDVRGYLRARAAADGGPEGVHPDAAARLVDLTRGRPADICRLVAGDGDEADGDDLPPWETRLAEARPGGGNRRPQPGDGIDGGKAKEGASERTPVAYGLSDARLPPVAARLNPPAGTTVGVIGLDTTRPKRSVTSRLAPVGFVVLSLVAAGWALWSERLSGPGHPRGGATALLSPPPPQETVPADPPANNADAPAAKAEPSAPAERVVASPSEPAPSAPAERVVAEEPTTAPPTASGDIAELIARGDKLLRLADLSTARQFYLLAARRGAAAGLTAAAGTYDPVYLHQLNVRAGGGDPRRAAELYREAVSKGDPVAAVRLRALTEAEGKAAAGNPTPAR